MTVNTLAIFVFGKWSFPSCKNQYIHQEELLSELQRGLGVFLLRQLTEIAMGAITVVGKTLVIFMFGKGSYS